MRAGNGSSTYQRPPCGRNSPSIVGIARTSGARLTGAGALYSGVLLYGILRFCTNPRGLPVACFVLPSDAGMTTRN